MKKTIIAGAAASVLAAMPVIGAFATNYTFTDNVKVNVEASCTMTSDPADGYSTSNAVNLGSYQVGRETSEKAGSTMKVACNTAKGWKIEATAANMTDSTKTIKFGAYPDAAAIKADGTESVWSVKLTATGTGAEVADGWDELTGEKSTDKTSVVTNTDGDADGATITTLYRAFIGGKQPAGEYTGSITYAFSTTD